MTVLKAVPHHDPQTEIPPDAPARATLLGSNTMSDFELRRMPQEELTPEIEQEIVEEVRKARGC